VYIRNTRLLELYRERNRGFWRELYETHKHIILQEKFRVLLLSLAVRARILTTRV